jgi:AraC-like DNA-binding protein/mannose-6-phosphate isomerase-like protein (cupin superfamily)
MHRTGGSVSGVEASGSPRGQAATFAVFSTEHLPARQQFEAWRARVSSLIDLSPEGDPRAGYVASNRPCHLGAIGYSPVIAPAVGFSRTPVAIRRDSIDHWMVLSVKRGSATFRFDDQVVVARPGVPVILPMGRPHSGQRTDGEWKALFLPRHTFTDISARLDGTSALALDTPFGQLLDDFLVSFDRALTAMSADQLTRLPSVISPLVAAAIGDRQGGRRRRAEENERGAVEIARRERVYALIRANLRSYTLGPRALCRMTGLSRSALYRLFEDRGGVAATIQRERLRMAYAGLSDPSDQRPIQAIAEGLAFADASTFARAFRAEFGCAPREVRLAALVGAPLSSAHADAASAGTADFVGLLRRL